MPRSLLLETPRLILHPWQEQDRAPFAALNADPTVMRFYFEPMTRQQSDEAITRYQTALDRDGFGFLAATHRASGAFVGILGLQTMRDIVPYLSQPAVEIGWRLAQEHHGQGLATEGALALVDFAFTRLRLPEIVAITVPTNLPSRRVMVKLGMTERPELSFDHPRIPVGHPYQRHVLYSLANPLKEALCSTPL